MQIDAIPPHLNLLDYVRSRGLTGAKEGCAEGECGACAVLSVRESAGRAIYEPVNSCLIPLPAVAGREIWTVESLAARGELAEVQTAMMARGGSQCGYCTPGFVVSMFAAHYRGDGVTRDVNALGGNLCRCTGYRPIRDALESLGPPLPGPFLSRLNEPAPRIEPLRYECGSARFSRPCSLPQCVDLAAEDSLSSFVAGNTDLGVMTNLHGYRFPHLISLEGIAELREFQDGPERVEIGAGLTLTEISDRWTGAPPVFGEWLDLFASPLIRNRATLGGNLATASPIGDAAPMLFALAASLLLSGPHGERLIPLDQFFTGYRKTCLAKGEVIRSVHIPKPFPGRARFYKVAKRRTDDISTVAAGIALVGEKMRIGLGGVAPVPVRLNRKKNDDYDLRDWIRPLSDHRGSAEYRLAVSQSLVEKFLADA